MERGARPPLYGQLQQKLPCGCSTYIDAAEVSEYVSRQQLLQAQGGRPEKLILKPGEPTQYYILEADRPIPMCSVQPPGNSDNPPKAGAQQPDVRSNKPNVVMQTDDIKLRLRVSDGPAEHKPGCGGASVPERQPLMEVEQEVVVAHEQMGPPPDVSYSAICKERLDNEANDEQQAVPKCSHLH